MFGFGQIGCAQFALEERERYWRQFNEQRIDSPSSRPRREEQEPELLRMVSRYHESAHIIAAHIHGLGIEGVCSRCGEAHTRLYVPAGGPNILIGYLITLAAARYAQRKLGAQHAVYENGCSEDDRQIEEMARKIAKSDAAADKLVDAVHRAAKRLVDERWDDIGYIARALEKLDDQIDGAELGRLLRHVKTDRQELIRRRDGFVSDELWTRKGLARPRGFDPVTREIDAVLSTGARVRRQDWEGTFDEVLGMKPENVRLARLNQGAAVLDSHNWSGMSAVLGGIVPGSARLESGSLIGRIKFSRGSALAQRIAQGLQDGIQIPLSVGYKVHQTREDRRTNPVTRTATDWEPIEVSVVPIAAEETGTGFRAAA
jgi:hypothetical protein